MAKIPRKAPFRDPDRPLEERIDDLVARLPLAVKAAQLLYSSPAIPALGIPAYNWWNECLHGVARAGRATVNDCGDAVAVPGRYRLVAAGACPVPRSVALGAPPPVFAEFAIN